MVLLLLLALSAHAAASSPWDRVGPHNIFNAYSDGGQGALPMGEAGTLAGASSLATAPLIIYAGGQNNGVSSGVIKTTDGGKHWVRKSNGIIYAGGQNNGVSSGIIKTTDGGKH